ncbi:hypothetical protein J2Z60_001593 [Lactobacillus colini]|uniref:Aggregation promoting factor n=1 Tax=Lactobacillus colini TaxID=1819254 RepID=A0ABS4MGF1_9LACO|nr:peptidoglycan-binding protein LysM [Lactobacillus colini]MBP2058414.1 hypothetical protein [Lactobacillus colini]
MNKFKSILIKLTAGAALAFTGVVAINTTTPAHTADAATTLKTKKITVDSKAGAKIWTSYYKGSFTGHTAMYGAHYNYTSSAVDAEGHMWFKIGENQWIKADDTIMGNLTSAAKKAQKTTKKKAKKSKKAVSQAPTSAEAAAKAWIAMRESGNNYYARNGQYIGKYQLSSAYLHGDYSPANQERVANNYVKSRYGSWVNAKNFWIRHGWY